ncbi:MAG: hypothetical protein ACJARF_002699 [Alteromonadaceae bacterium]|jgi:hypothetical protein
MGHCSTRINFTLVKHGLGVSVIQVERFTQEV